VAGPGTFVTDLLDVAGADNVFADLTELYAPVSLEELLARDVDAYVMTRGSQVDARLRARAPVIEVPPQVEAPGTGLGRSATELGRALHPDAFR
jgi:ABC-type Fe3+-hydroxamate transport system substrate-binding protein